MAGEAHPDVTPAAPNPRHEQSGRGQPGRQQPGHEQPGRRRRSGWWSWLLLIQFVAVLWPPFFNRTDPRWLGMPFFYWYQLLWVVLGAVCTATVYLLTRDERSSAS